MFWKVFVGILFIVGVVFLILLFWRKPFMQNTDAKIRYVALGDSYSNGEGETPHDAWPVVLTQHLKQTGHDIELVANPSMSGFTTQDLIENELPVFISSRPTFASLLIGANDLFQGRDVATFKTNFIYILDTMEANMQSKKKIILITVPDYSITPQARMYEIDTNEQKKIEEVNEIIKKEGERRGLPVVDIFDLSKDMGKDDSLVTADGLHPSAKELKLWEEKIFPVADKLLKK